MSNIIKKEIKKTNPLKNNEKFSIHFSILVHQIQNKNKKQK